MPLTSQDAFAAAVAAFQAGRLEAAAALVTALARELPDHFACLHLLGVIEHRRGRPDAALPVLRRAVALQPAMIEAQYNLGQVLMTLRQFDEAAAVYRAVLARQPDYMPARHALGNALRGLGDRPGALAAYQAVVAARPDDVEALNSLGTLYCEMRDFKAGLPVLAHALAQRPQSPELMNNLAVARQELGEHDAAAALAERALALQPGYLAALNTLGNARRGQRRFGEAAELYNAVLKQAPRLTEARNNLGLVLMDAGFDLAGAAACFRAVLVQMPNHAQALNNLGIVLCHQGRLQEGVASYRAALAVQPDYAHALNNLGNALRTLGDTRAALAIYRQVVALLPDYAEAHNNLAMALLAVGEFDEGWREYEWRWRTDQLAAGRRGFTQPPWTGAAASYTAGGETLLLHAEQGFGDTLQFCRYAPLAAARGFRVVLEAQPALVRLLACLPGIDQVVATGAPLPEFDWHCPLMSLPGLLGMPGRVAALTGAPYLTASAADVARFAALVPAAAGRLRVGLVWAGSERKQSAELISTNRRRSLDPELLRPLFDVPGIDFYSLQKMGPAAPADVKLIDLMDACHDFADTAALIMQLDLVIGVDTAVAHLAAALGQPVWLLNRFDTCWRWGLAGDDSDWYETLRQFRQPAAGEWGPVLAAVQAALEQRLTGSP